MKKVRFAAIATVVCVAAALVASAQAHPGRSPVQIYRAHLDMLNGSGASGEAILQLRGNALRVIINAHGLVANAPHAQHIHGVLGGTNVCPPASADTDGDGIVSTPEGRVFYGGIDVSLTTSGDTSPASALAVDRFPVADADGNLHYKRTITISDELAANLGSLHIVQHGIDVNGNATYDFGAGPSPLAPSLPLEATAPADCGAIQQIH